MVEIFVEGGSPGLGRKNLRKAFSEFFKRAGVKVKPSVTPCGGRDDTLDDYMIAVGKGTDAWLLVDSESPVHESCRVDSDDVESWLPWRHLASPAGGGWTKPKNVEEIHCHLMVQFMEYWFVADPDALEEYYDDTRGFRKNALSKASNIEDVDQDTLMDGLENATRGTKKGPYDKGRDSHAILKLVDPDKIAARSPWVDRLLQMARKKI